jgi:hypothetical protein
MRIGKREMGGGKWRINFEMMMCNVFIVLIIVLLTFILNFEIAIIEFIIVLVAND